MILSLILAAALALSPMAATAADVEIPVTVTEETAPMWELTLERHEARRRAGYKPEREAAVKMEYLGRYWITGYDACKACCGKTDGITASGTKAQVGRTCAAPKSFTFGERLYIDGLGERVVEDRGGAIKGAKIDVFCTDHPECYAITGWYDVYRIVG